ncbi:MAG: YicC family protein [Pirellulales bacterium]|nr:YicC family protein [Pirellulales bacterium]
MTGFGEARAQDEHLAVSAEVRTINSRHFKLNVRTGDGYTNLESNIDSVVRKFVKRGTVQVSVRVTRHASPEDVRLNTDVLAYYRERLNELQKESGDERQIAVEQLLALAGVVEQRSADEIDTGTDWPLIGQTLERALTALNEMRAVEGRAPEQDLRENAQVIANELAGIKARVPDVTKQFRERLTERIAKSLAEHDVELDAASIIREVSMFAERADVSEEVVRLESHLEQFDELLSAEESNGKKLEFLQQEMLRETNTIGSKANDVVVARHVIEIKACLERIREQVQNVE